MQSFIVEIRRLLRLLSLAAALATTSSGVSLARDLDVVPCNQLFAYYWPRLTALTRQESACTSRAGLYAPWTFYRDGTCTTWGARECVSFSHQCSSVKEAYDRAKRECARQEEDERRFNARAAEERRSRPSDPDRTPNRTPASARSLLSLPGQRQLATTTSRQIAERHAKRSVWQGTQTAFDTARDQTGPLGPRLLGTARWADRHWGMGSSLWNLAAALSGRTPEERSDAAFNLAHEGASLGASYLAGPASMFAGFSFVILKAMQESLVNDLNDVSSQIALFRMNDRILQAEQTLWFNDQQAQWRDYVATRSASATSGTVDMSMVDLVNEARAKAAQIAAAQALQAKAAQEAQEKAERDAQAVRDARQRAAREAALRAQEQQYEQQQQELEQEYYRQRQREQQQMQQIMNGLVGGVINGLSNVPRPAPAPAPGNSVPRQAPSRPSGGAYDCPRGARACR